MVLCLRFQEKWSEITEASGSQTLEVSQCSVYTSALYQCDTKVADLIYEYKQLKGL